MHSTTQTTLVCPNCGGGRLATRESAEIWQPATFVLDQGEGAERNVEVEWDAFDSEDVGETVTIGYACKDCQWTWDAAEGEPPPFLTPEEFATQPGMERGYLVWQARDIGYGIEQAEGEYVKPPQDAALVAGKVVFMPYGGGETIYLFRDEIVSWQPRP